MGILRADRITGLGGADAITGSTFFGGGVSAESGSASQNNLQLDISSDFNLGTNNFTIEAFIYLDALGQFNNILAVGTDSTNGYRMDLGTGNNLRLVTKLGSDSWGVLITGSTTFIKDKWYHVAVTRSGNSFDLWVDGTKDATTVTNSGAFSDATVSSANSGTNNIGVEIGSLSTYGFSRKFNGYISNLHLVNGTALYTSNYTIPTTRLEKRSDTVILTCNSAGNVLNEETGKTIIKHSANINSQGPVASRFTPNSPVGFSTTTDVGSQYGSTFDGFGSFATSTYMVPPGGNTRERGRGRGVLGGGFNGVSPNNHNVISYVEVQSGGIFKDFGDLTLVRSYFPAGQTSSSTRGIFAGGYGGGGGYNTIDFITIANTGNAIDFGDISVAKFGQGGLSNQTRALFGGNSTAPFDNIIEFVTIATTGNAQDFGDLVKQRGLTAGASSSTRGVFTGGRSNTPSSNAQDNIMEYVTIATTGNTQDFGDLSTTTRYGHTGFSSPTRGISAGGFDPSGQAKTIDYFTIATLGNSSDFGDLSAVTGYCGSVTNSTRGAVTINNQPNYYNTLEFITIATLGDAQDYGDADVGSSKGHGDFPACASDSHGGVA